MNEQEISEMMTNSLDSFKSMKSEQWLASGTRSMQPTAIMVSRGGKPYPVPGDLLGPAQDNIPATNTARRLKNLDKQR